MENLSLSPSLHPFFLSPLKNLGNKGGAAVRKPLSEQVEKRRGDIE